MSAATATDVARPARAACLGPCAGLCGEDGFVAAYREHRPQLVGRARAMLGDPGLAEDAVQEAFVRAWAACATFDPAAGPPLIAWLATIMRHVVIDVARARALRPRLPRSPDAEPAPSTTTSAIDSAVLRMLLLDALSGVSADHRGIVLRAVVRDRSYADVAAELDLPVGTVKSRVFYALRRMRSQLDRSELLA